MQAFVFSFAFDATGTPDEITLPQDFPLGMTRIILKPPTGRAWTFYGPGGSGYALSVDEALTLTREGQAPFMPGETIGRAELDTGSGSGTGLAT